MLEMKRSLNNTYEYVCNFCGKVYDIRDIVWTKGNTYFCSFGCVVDYDRHIKEEK